MTSILVNSEDTIKFDIFIGVDKEDSLVVSSKRDDLKLEDEKVIKHTVTIKSPTYKDNVSIASRAITSDGETVNIDPAMARYEKFVLLLKGWSFVGPKNEPIPANRDSIDNLNPAIASVIIDRIDEIVGWIAHLYSNSKRNL